MEKRLEKQPLCETVGGRKKVFALKKKGLDARKV